MRKQNLLLFLSMLISSFYSYSQDALRANDMLAEIRGKYELDDNGNVTYSKVIEVPNQIKDELFLRAQSYFAYNYVDANEVIQIEDKDKGVIVAKGVYDNVHVGQGLITTYVDCWHLVRVDIKDYKVRVIVTLTQYHKRLSGGSTPDSYFNVDVKESYPINPSGTQRTVMTKAFYKAHYRALDTVTALEKALKEGNTSFEIENSDW